MKIESKIESMLYAIMNKAFTIRTAIVVLFLVMFIPVSIENLNITELRDKVSAYPEEAAVLFAEDLEGAIQGEASRETMGVSYRNIATVIRGVERQREVRTLVVLPVAVIFFAHMLKGKVSGVFNTVFSNRTNVQKYLIAYIDAQDGCKAFSSLS